MRTRRWKHGTTHTGVGYALPAPLPDKALLRQAADVLNAGKRVAMLVGGRGAAGDRRGDGGETCRGASTHR